MTRWGMVIDLARCVGCYACTVACKEENGTPAGVWFAPVYEREVGTFPATKREFLPTLCMHCEDAPCLKACPTGAISKRDDGIVLIDQETCAGTRACVAACPYGAITYVPAVETEFEAGPTPFETATAKIRPGTSHKCNFGAHRVDEGYPEPACVQACPTNCRVFGDLEDPHSNVSQLIRIRNGKQPREEAGTRPAVYYLR